MFRNTLFSIILCLVFCAGLFSSAAAGQVTFEISTTTQVAGDRVLAAVKLTNRGTETAHQVSAQAIFNKQQQSVFISRQIDPAQSAQADIAFDLLQEVQGSLPLYLIINYQHADAIGVSSASLAVVNIGRPAETLLDVTAAKGTRPGEVIVQVEAKDTGIARVELTGHGPEDLSIEPRVQEVSLTDGKGLATFLVFNISGNPGSSYGIFFVAEYDRDGLHHLATANLNLPVEETRPLVASHAETVKNWLHGALLACLAILAGIVMLSSRARQWFFRVESVPHLLDIAVLILVEVFIFSKFDLPSLIAATTTTGGDTASHFYTLQYLKGTLLPAGRISGWTMGNYGGFPILQFYFPLPFLLMTLLDLIMPLQVAFKLVSLLGTALLPVCAFGMLRLIRCPFPGPGIGAALMLPFLFNGANSMWGGNILSTLAGEFTYSLSMALSLVLIGSLYRGAQENRYVIGNAILVFLVGFSHGYTLLFVEAMSLFILMTPTGFVHRLVYLFKVYALGFCLLAFWLVPLLVFTKYTTSYHLVWTIRSIHEIIPEILLPFIAVGIFGSMILLIWGLRTMSNSGSALLAKLGYLWFGLLAAAVFFVAAPRIGVVDIRYVPYGQLMACLLAALSFGWLGSRLLNRWGLNLILMVLVVAFTMHWTNDRLGTVQGWSKWNYEGFEGKKTWPVFYRINQALQGDFQDPRVVYEHSSDHNIFGSTRAFESLPLFAGRATLEGLYMQASISAPFIFYIQSEVSKETSQPFPQYNYTIMDFDRAREHLKLFNVRDLIIRSSAAKQAIRKAAGYELKQSIGYYELWELTTNSDRYVELFENEPVFYQGNSWKEVSYQWFTRDDLMDVHLVFDPQNQPGQSDAVKLSTASLDTLPKVRVDAENCQVRETVGNDTIQIDTTCINKPLLVKVSYHPNWRVEGAERIYLVSPSFMLIYPQQQHVQLSYGPGPWDRSGMVLSVFSMLVLLFNIPVPGRSGQTSWSLLAGRLHIPEKLAPMEPDCPATRLRWIILALVVTFSGIAVAWVSYQTYTNEPYRIFNRSIILKDGGQYEEARSGFKIFMQAYPLSNLSRASAYYIAITYYLEKKDPEAIEAFEELIRSFPQSNWVPEAHYHIGMSLLRSNREQAGIQKMEYVAEIFPETPWAKYAADRLQEHRVRQGKKPLDIHTGTLNYYMGKAISYFNEDRLAEAKPILQEIVDRYPGFAGTPQALAVLALSYYKEDDCMGTIKNYQKLMENYPDNDLVPEALFHLGLCNEKLGRNKTATVYYRRLLDGYPQSVFGKQVRELLE